MRLIDKRKLLTHLLRFLCRVEALCVRFIPYNCSKPTHIRQRAIHGLYVCNVLRRHALHSSYKVIQIVHRFNNFPGYVIPELALLYERKFFYRKELIAVVYLDVALDSSISPKIIHTPPMCHNTLAYTYQG
jgi:hypothetical protein